MRMPIAMRVMVNEITSVREDATFVAEETDGYGVARVLMLDLTTSAMLRDVLYYLVDSDERLLDIWVEHDHVHVRFVTDARAENKQPFSLDKALIVLGGPYD